MAQPKEIAGYRVLAKIGEGAASELYAVQDPRTKQVWALKHVVKHSEKDQRFIEQVENEHAVGSRLDHPCVRGIHRLVKRLPGESSSRKPCRECHPERRDSELRRSLETDSQAKSEAAGKT